MPRAVKSNETASSPAVQVPAPFVFPTDYHLIITTSGGILSWDKSGVKRLFNSSKKGILAAKEARDGSQLLAVADKHTVVLHDCKRGREESWGLEGDEVGRITVSVPERDADYLIYRARCVYWSMRRMLNLSS